jgi:hypothetical protein
MFDAVPLALAILAHALPMMLMVCKLIVPIGTYWGNRPSVVSTPGKAGGR